jgi:choline transport protein
MEKNMAMQNIDDDGLRARGKNSISDQKRTPEFDQDRYDLARVGKEQVLKVCVAQP